MPFNIFKSLTSAAEAAEINIEMDNILPELELVTPDPMLERLLAFSQSRRKSSSGEMFLREFYISPILHFSLLEFDYLNIWANDYALQYEEPFSGYPDYLITGMSSPLGAQGLVQRPFLAVAQAKKDNFDEGWGQCLAELYACRKLNPTPDAAIWGIVSTGQLFGSSASLKAASFLNIEPPSTSTRSANCWPYCIIFSSSATTPRAKPRARNKKIISLYSTYLVY